ncbi:hypothetical protein RchiOBHm_Chr1g0322661 [Rosa chinensis]|uniref:Uncharacterized protein n=1 Tax=Rosa chinensis TaxID=74649 RepID=A0A2P6S9C7_ROSCH|nr:hypothetical protein RchiOBHm_Chr1g0322661 [Rosa chinensis]
MFVSNPVLIYTRYWRFKVQIFWDLKLCLCIVAFVNQIEGLVYGVKLIILVFCLFLFLGFLCNQTDVQLSSLRIAIWASLSLFWVLFKVMVFGWKLRVSDFWVFNCFVFS